MRRNLLLTAIAALTACTSLRADVVTDWNEILLDAIRVDRTSPPVASRAMAIVHVAIYDAVNGVDPTHEAYYVESTAAADGASAEAAAVAAAHLTLSALFPMQVETFNAAATAALAEIADGAAKDAGIAWGEQVAAAILTLRTNDGSGDVVDYTPGNLPGNWIPTPAGFAAALLPQWPEVTPFAMTSGSQFRTGGPPALTSAEYATACNDVKAFGRAEGSSRTEDQSQIARFWVNGPGTATPPGHWNMIAQTVAEQQGNTLAENARLFALLNIALADAAIVSWDNKYTYDHWRPVTAIVMADTDGNDATEADAAWLPFIPTPPFPEYTSGHSTFSGAAAKVLELFFGTDDIAFTTPGDGLPDVERSYTSFSQAADESGRSRIYGGIHFEYANQDGLRSGRDLGEFVSETLLQEIDDDPAGPALCGALGLGNAVGLIGLALGLCLAPRRRMC